MIDRPESTRSTLSHKYTFESDYVVVPSDNSSNSSSDHFHWENDSVDADIVNTEPDDNANYKNRRSDCNDSPLRRQLQQP